MTQKVIPRELEWQRCLFCQICRRNHDQGRKHVFSKKHKKILITILKKYGTRIKECRPYLQKPSIEDGELEPGASFWCHFCETSVDKHVTDRDKTIRYGGLFEHLASESHWTHLDTFWHVNGAESKYKPSFIISRTDFEQYKTKVKSLLEEMDAKDISNTMQLAVQIRCKEDIQADIASRECKVKSEPEIVEYKTLKNHYGVVQNPTGWHDGVRVWGGGIVKYKLPSNQWIPWEMDMYHKDHLKANPKVQLKLPVDTIPSTEPYESVSKLDNHLVGLTKVTNQKYDHKRGTIHTGAVPPWLCEDVEEESASSSIRPLIGPSEEIFVKHLERKGKLKKKNPKRVGANFDHHDETREDWLPSFGGVWNEGARWKSRRHYHKEAQKRK